MKTILKYSSVLVIIVFFASCKKNIDKLYEGKARIQFKYYSLDFNKKMILNNKTTYSFGMKDESVVIDTAKIVVEFLGAASNVDRTYKVKVAPDSTTAKEGVHYELISKTQTFKAGAYSDTLKVVVLKGSLSKSFKNPEDMRLALELEPSDDFDLGMKEGLKTYLHINNYLSEPVWWNTSLRYNYIGFYHPKKWKILISFNAQFANAETCPFDVNNSGRQYFQGLANYLNSIPTFDDETGSRIYIDKLVP